ncbi:NHLM bacteriocin system ABC transporter, ATP-binding protein [Rivularia sp. PCC 7116]|uniref:NHLP bacteriocin export ABC transporter permease/ATPase subunit n=1 Tax=Rivularia sp. PCC 7116 TaxID=373994 RepID=UPI00029EC8EF|nr:NHLP bacteriocin export ABC transporter permease/ATPase subunit [Rivularia sp. PCC 7116]AFY58608.1 NHLM bacteriocin system ABC transporter, ATP-binding protein [Rivularia sp. PCC 7116]
MNIDKNAPKNEFIFKANQPLLLDDPSVVWMIESGTVALFAVVIQDGIPVSERRYLFSCNPTEALFAIDSTKVKSIVTSNDNNDHPKKYGILAVAIEEASLTQILQDDFEALRSNDSTRLIPKSAGKEFIQLAETWIEKFSIFPGVVNASSIFDTSVAYTWDDASVLHTWERVSEKLGHLHRDFLRYFEKLEQDESQEKLAQFQAREQLNRRVTETSLRELASIFKTKSQGFIQEDSELLMAAGAVGRTLGITIRPPVKSEDLNRVKEPIEAIARASRIRMRRVILTPNWWKKDAGPLIGYVGEEKRPVALLPASSGNYDIFDPKICKRIPLEKFIENEELEPVAYMFYRSLPEKASKAIELIKFAVRGRLKDLAVVIIAGVIGTLLGMLTPQATSIIIDKAIPDADRGLLVQISFGLLAASFGTAVFQLTQSFASLRLESSSDATTQAAVWDKLLTLRMSFFRAYSIGDLQSRVSAISQMRQYLSSSTLQTIFTSFFSLLNLALLFYYNSRLALVAIGVAVVSIIITSISGIITRRKLRPLEEIQGDISGLMVQLIGGVSKLRISGAENRAFAHWSKKYTKQLKLMLSSQLIEDLVGLFNILIPTIASIIIFALSANLMFGANTQNPQASPPLTAGTFLAFNSAFGTFMGGVVGLSNTIISILEVIVLWGRAKPILIATSEIDLSKADPGKLTGTVELEHISFRYREDGPLILNDVNIKAAEGEFIAFVGPSGSGKSTIIRLLLGFDTPEVGTVYYDGQDLSGLDISAVRRQLGVVLQNGRISSASIFENISGGALITMDEAWEAARMAGFAEDIEGMPMGMHTVISEGGTNLSGGQRQRLLIARSLVLKPKILIFDEATSALDNRTQAIVSESLDQLQVTRIVIAHRLSTIRNADRIYVIEAGRVMQQGNFEQLSQQEGLFASLMARQMA